MKGKDLTLCKVKEKTETRLVKINKNLTLTATTPPLTAILPPDNGRSDRVSIKT